MFDTATFRTVLALVQYGEAMPDRPELRRRRCLALVIECMPVPAAVTNKLSDLVSFQRLYDTPATRLLGKLLFLSSSPSRVSHVSHVGRTAAPPDAGELDPWP
jgi:hypothetical protein